MRIERVESGMRADAGATDAVEMHPRHRVGILAALIALGLSAAFAVTAQHYAVSASERYLQALAGQAVPIKWESLTLQRAAYATGTTLPIYGSSELYCCGVPALPSQLFGAAPTGFRTFPVGRAGTGDLFFMQTFAALGGDLRGKKLVISDSPGWFFGPQGIGDAAYAGNFSPEIAEAFAFDAPISMDLKEAGARLMIAHPATLSDQPLLRLALDGLARPTALHLARYYALYPAGRLLSWVHQMQDAADTLSYIREHPALRADASNGPSRIDWRTTLAAMTSLSRQRVTTNPFGFPDATYKRLAKTLGPALARFCAGTDDHNGTRMAYPSAWARSMSSSAEWTDLELELRVLNELGARPLVYSLPMPGTYDDFTQLSYPARRAYYAKYASVATAAGVPWLDFEEHDGDRYTLTDTGAHFSPRGWVLAGRALDLFWQGASISQIRSSLADLTREVPTPAAPPRARYCAGPKR
ncbi:MAG: hypothetical protein KGJ98_13530 [Chloroflexota bacterium]|nr:hypothetical protein [Chloroflexota bacterium]